MHLVCGLYYLYQWCTVKQISDKEIYLLNILRTSPGSRHICKRNVQNITHSALLLCNRLRPPTVKRWDPWTLLHLHCRYVTSRTETALLNTNNNNNHHMSVMELDHLLTRSGLTYLEVSSKVCHDSLCQLRNSISLPWVIYYESFYLHVISSFSCIPVICPKLMLFLIPSQFVYLFCWSSVTIILTMNGHANVRSVIICYY